MLEIVKNLYRFSESKPHQLALVFDEEKFTYREFIQVIDERTNLLTDIQKNERVGLLSDHPINNLINYFAIHNLGGLPCFLNHQWSESTVKQLVEKYQIEWLIQDKELLSTGCDDKNFEDNIKNPLLHIGFTSGTTGLPKAYYRNEPSWLSSYEENEKLINHTSQVIVAPGPLSHSLSLYACIYALFTGRTFIGQKVFNAEALIDNIIKVHQPSALFVVPTMLHQLVMNDLYASNISTIFSSGAKLSKEQFDNVTQRYPYIDLIEFFGTSEASFISYNLNQSAPEQSVGTLFPNVEIQLLEQDSNQIGLLMVRSDMTFSGYVNEHVVDETWIETGDYAYIENRNLYLVGRKSDRLIVGGVNVYPSEIERLVMKLNCVEEAIIIGQPHHKFGEILVLLYTGNEELEYIKLKQYLTKYLSRYEVPSKIKKIDAMMYTESGKIARGKMKSKYLNGEI
ncbi:AMP-binding protein [Staphylococcus caprae]|uniref:AMP-binding protein n=1 Tax=Staphylococcus TaxID=1279 RepID=UPI0008A9F54B|nr:AMP-binding protein [Staphylococcus sp. HMSC62A08]OHS38982.1 long-chain fatty acid--CoA ligase [Staphylococcus sp. HMSC62A08]